VSNLLSNTAVLYGGPSPEHDVSVLTGLQAVKTLQQEATSELFSIYWAKTGDFYLVDLDLEAKDFLAAVPRSAVPLNFRLGSDGGFFVKRGKIAAKWEHLDLDVVVNCCHGGPGEDGSLQGALDLAQIKYTGPTAFSAALGMDKLAFETLVSSAGLPTLGRFALSHLSEDKNGFFAKGSLSAPPYILKPRYGGSSIGIEVVGDLETAFSLGKTNIHFRNGAVIESYRPDLYDLQIAIRSWPKLELSVIEKPLRSTDTKEILSYSDKYAPGVGMSQAPREIPAKIEEELAVNIRQAAMLVAKLTELRGVARIDFLSDGKEWFVNEINTIPGSLSRHLFTETNLPFSLLLSDMIEEALNRPSVSFSVAGSDGLVLRDATSIAAKLS